MTSSPTAIDILTRHGQAVEQYLQQALDGMTGAPPRLIEAMRYSLLAGGKRLRPALVLECFAVSREGIKTSPVPVLVSAALPAAAAMELIHTFSLVHDDLPAMDNDDLRRGRPTNHKVYGEAMAILAGDGMTTLAFELIARHAAPATAAAQVAELARASGPEGMIGGQVLDMDSEQRKLSLEDLQHLHRLKTGALLTASCRLGAIAAEAPAGTLAALTSFGQHLGLAFQIIDDCLDVTSTPEQMGKATNKDAAKGKNTYPQLLGLEKAKSEAQRALEAALVDLGPLGPAADGLRAIARFVVERKN